MSEAYITREQFEALVAEVTALRVENTALKAEVADLKAQLAAARRNSRNSSRPPSTEHPHAKPAPKPHAKPKASNGKPGGQPGHDRHVRELLPVEKCTTVVDHSPPACRGCGARLKGVDPAPDRKQVWDIPPIVPEITEHRRHRLTCSCCGKVTAAALREGMPTCEAGPRLVALVALLMSGYRCGKRKTAEFVRDVLNIPCSPGWVVKLQNVAQDGMHPEYEGLVSQLPAQPALNIDESPTKQAKIKAWVWTFVASRFTVFTIRLSRKAEPLREYLGEAFHGIVGCDRAKMYHSLGRVQWCWAHLIRDFRSWIDSDDGSAKTVGRDLMRPVGRMFELWWKVRDGTLDRAEFPDRMRSIRKEVRDLLLRGEWGPSDLARPTCAELVKHEDRLWQFVDHAEIEPTNNSAERALRQAVIQRKLSFGTQSAAGSRFVETMLTVVETCRQQGRSAYAFVTAALQAHYAGTSAPTLTGV
jgi:transposase